MSRIITEMEMRGLWKELDLFDKELSAESDKLQDLWRSIYEVKGTLESELQTLVTIKTYYMYLFTVNAFDFYR